jgi:hypothetical protein
MLKKRTNHFPRLVRGFFPLMAVFSLLLASCPLNFPEKIQLKASPSIYLPLGEGPLDSALDLSTGLGELMDIDIPVGANIDVYDYQGKEYGDTRVLMMVMKDLVDVDFTTFAGFIDALADLDDADPTGLAVPAVVDFPPSGNIAGVAPPAMPGLNGDSDEIDLSGLLGVGGMVNDYPGLMLRSVPVYIYVNGPPTLLKDGDVTIDLEFNDPIVSPSPASPLLSEQKTVTATVFPNLPVAATPPGVVSAFSPKSPISLDLKDIFNQQPEGLEVSLELNISPGAISIPKNKLRAFAAELRNNNLTAHLILLLPFQFTVDKTTAPDGIAVFAGPTGTPTGPNPAIELVTGGADLLGRTGSGDGLEEILEQLKALGLEVTVENNLGINGYVSMLDVMPDGVNTPEPLGKIKLSGKSTVMIPSDKLGIPFSPALEVYLEGDFDIKRSLPGGVTLDKALKMTMGAILKTDIDMVL